jgi:uncharacterized membrane protein YidH (DUF202 family)
MAIISGAFKLFSLLAVAGVFFFIPVSSVHADVGRMEIITIMMIVIIPLIALGVLSIIGGIHAIRRQRYVWRLPELLRLYCLFPCWE